jgi:hypothetical protein
MKSTFCGRAERLWMVYRNVVGTEEDVRGFDVVVAEGWTQSVKLADRFAYLSHLVRCNYQLERVSSSAHIQTHSRWEFWLKTVGEERVT